jgi:glycosyltransferase involved in cell wall biosynthesis
LTRVLFLVESFHPVLGGGEGHIRMLATRLAATGMPCVVLTRRGSREWPREEVLDGVRVVRVRPSGPGKAGKYAMVPGVVAGLARLRRAYDVIVVRGGRILGLPALTAGRILGKGVVLQSEVTGEMSGEIYTWGTGLDRWPVRALVRWSVALRNLLLRRADAFVAVSSRILDEHRAAGIPVDRIAWIPHGVDTERYRPAEPEERRALRARLGLPEAARIVIFTGRLLRGKGVDVLIDAFAQVSGHDALAHLLVVGSGEGQALSVENEIRSRVRTAGLDGRITFTGRVDNVDDHLRAADVFAFPSFFEALPLSVIEAASCGLACVATPVGGIVDVLDDGRSGIFVATGDIPGLAAALAGLLADPERRKTLGAAAREAVERRFDFSASVERYRALFSDVAARRPPAL